VELLINAVEHGNCRITYEEKEKWLTGQKNIMDLIREKNRDPDIHRKKVILEYSINPPKATFTIKDEGDGFDWKARQNKPLTIEEMAFHGRGIHMAEHYTASLHYNQRGNSVSFDFGLLQDMASVLPGGFASEKVVFQHNETVFEENESSNYLYYIVTGRFKVYSQGKELSTLTPQDMFLGEMSFLLNNRRSATVKSMGKSELLRISKKDFLDAMKRKPHYSIFLARLLAQRLSRLNALSGSVVY